MTVETTARPRIAREALHDRSGGVAGYELTFGAGPEDDLACTRLITQAFGEFGLDRVGIRRNLYLAMPRSLLTGRVAVPFGPHHVVLEALAPMVVDDELVAGVTDLRARGYRIVMDAAITGPAQDALLPLADFVKVDVWALDADRAELAQYIREQVPQAQLIADGVRDAGDLADCLRAGFDRFVGPHFHAHRRPRSRHAGAQAVGPSSMASFQLLAALATPETSVDELERIVATDPGLSLRVLTAVNSASGAGRAVGSLRQAVVLLGRRALSGWVLLAALGGQDDVRREEEMVEVLTRAGACELLSDQVDVDADSAYTAGMLGGLTDVLGVDPQDVARAARLDDEMSAAITDHSGPIGELLDAVTEYQHTRNIVDSTVFDWQQLERANVSALGAAMKTLNDVLGALTVED